MLPQNSGQKDQPYLVIITGPPGSGKTTLARRLAAHFALPLMTKDIIKESLFETLGWSDRDWSQKLGRASTLLLYQFAEAQLTAGQSCIVECNFHTIWATPEFLELQQRHAFIPIQIVCHTSPQVLVERYQRRAASGERHPGHLDQTLASSLTAADAALWDKGPLEIGGHLIELDTTDFAAVDYDRLFAQIGTWLGSSPGALAPGLKERSSPS
ncbi:MAG: ATP-binding protein [Chloroflexi bacterium]|nr:ATP-binding protein [Chloroflexota bacterium]